MKDSKASKKPYRNRRFRRPKREVEEKSCGVILYRNTDSGREYLILHYPGGHWDFPKGHVEEFDDHEMETAHRELEEETSIKDISFIDGYREPMYYEFNRGRKELVKKTVVYFVAEAHEDAVTLSHEHKGYDWLPFEPAMKQLTFDNARDLLRKAEDFLFTNAEA